MKWLPNPELPLLRRELIELSNRRRTYVVRTLGGVILSVLVLLILLDTIQNLTYSGRFRTAGNNPYQGMGEYVIPRLVPVLFHTVHLILPALCCAAITSEKERNTLGNLLLTRMKPGAIVLEKTGSRLIPMMTLILLTCPLLAFTYSLGGVDTTSMIAMFWLLICDCVLCASLSILCSVWFTTTVSAFVASYVIVGLLIVFGGLNEGFALNPYVLWQQDISTDALTVNLGRGSGLIVWNINITGLLTIISKSLLHLCMAATAFLLARFLLFRRAFVSSSSPLLRVFRRVDSFFVWLNDHTTGVDVVRDTNALPQDDPVAWRERTKKSLGKARYLFRMLILIEVPTAIICLLTAITALTSATMALRVLLVMTWILAGIVIIVKAATLFSSERARETLEALLSTPMTARDITIQKIRGMRRLMLVLSIPILTVHLTLVQMLASVGTLIARRSYEQLAGVVVYAFVAVLQTFVIMHLFAWGSVLLGARQRSQMRSVLLAAVVLALCTGGTGVMFLRITDSQAAGNFRQVHQGKFLTGDESVFESSPIWVSAAAYPFGPVTMNEALLAGNTAAGAYDYDTITDIFVSTSRSGRLILTPLLALLQLAGVFLLRSIVVRMMPGRLERLEDSTSNAASPEDFPAAVRMSWQSCTNELSGA